MKKLKVAWFSAGVSSLIATCLSSDVDHIIYIDIDDQHEDSMRFVQDSEKLLSKKIEILKSPLANVNNAILQMGMISIPVANTRIASCTKILKHRPRKEWEQKYGNVKLEYIWGLDCSEVDRMDGIIKAMPDADHKFPLIDKLLSKQDAHALCQKYKVKRPYMYDLGYQNNNCIGCVKGGMGYFNKIRVDFPDYFNARAEVERTVGHSCLKDKSGAVFLDKLDSSRGNFPKEIMQECSFFCQI